MQPAQIVVRETMPHNQNGKIDRRALADEHCR
jgi:acyl-coenzyme A synthetase/AMP-(fatty) acid ligase